MTWLGPDFQKDVFQQHVALLVLVVLLQVAEVAVIVLLLRGNRRYLADHMEQTVKRIVDQAYDELIERLRDE